MLMLKSISISTQNFPFAPTFLVNSADVVGENSFRFLELQDSMTLCLCSAKITNKKFRCSFRIFLPRPFFLIDGTNMYNVRRSRLAAERYSNYKPSPKKVRGVLRMKFSRGSAITTALEPASPPGGRARNGSSVATITNFDSERSEREGEAPCGFATGGGDVSPS